MPRMDRFDLYDLCVTEPQRLARFLRAAHGRSPRVLREDFSGSAALCREWARSDDRATAIAVDIDAEPLKRLSGAARIRAVRSDVKRCRLTADVIACTNFPLGYFHERADLLAYLRHARRCLRAGGVLVADTYGGHDSFRTGEVVQKRRGPSGERVEYVFEQRHANAATGRVTDVLHFRVWAKGSRVPRVFRDAFTYDWRLWSVPELRDAITEAGFRAVEVHDRLGAAVTGDGSLIVAPMSGPPDDNFVAHVVARR